jgi:hypothetical protein
MENKFKYLLFPDKIYVLTFEGFDGKEFSVEVMGRDILSQIRRNYAIDNMLEDLDKPDHE